MVMTVPETKNAPSKLRTFAHDMEIERAKRGQTSSVSLPTATKTSPTSVRTYQKDQAVATKQAPNKQAAVTAAAAVVTVPTSAPKTKPAIPTRATLAPSQAKVAPVKETPKAAPSPIPPKPIVKEETKNTPTPSPVSSTVKTAVTPNAPVKLTASQSRDSSYAATIITDSKHKRFRLTSEIVRSVSDWWQEQLKQYEERKKPKYTVPVVDRRKGVVEKATSTTGRVATHDHKEIVARIKAEKQNAATVSVATVAPVINEITESVATPDPLHTIAIPSGELPAIFTPVDNQAKEVTTWTEEKELDTEIVVPLVSETIPEIPKTETVSADLIKPIIPVIPEIKDEKDVVDPFRNDIVSSYGNNEFVSDWKEINTDPEVSPVTLVSEETIGPEPIVPPTNPAPAFVFPPIKPILPKETTFAVDTTPLREEIPISTQREDVEIPLSVPKPPAVTSAALAARKEALGSSATVTPTKSPFSLRLHPLVILSGVVLITGVSLAYIFLAASPTTDTEIAETPNNLPIIDNEIVTTDTSGLVGDTSVQLTTNNKLALFTTIVGAKNPNQPLTLVTPLAAEGNYPLMPREIINLINRRLVADFVSGIVDIDLGYYKDSPVMVMAMSDEKVARGGMFAWERTLSSDLSPWFGAPIANQSFTDGQSNNIDIRILKDQTGETRIVYGIGKNNTLIITNSEEAFLNVSTTYLPQF